MRQRNIQLLSVFQYELSPVQYSLVDEFGHLLGGGPRVVVSTSAFHARAQGSFLGLGGLKRNKHVSSPSTCETQYCGEPL